MVGRKPGDGLGRWADGQVAEVRLRDYKRDWKTERQLNKNRKKNEKDKSVKLIEREKGREIK